MWAIHSPGEKVDYHQDWTEWMESGDTISSSSWTIEPVGPTLSGEAVAGGEPVTTVFVEDLELGISYELRNTIVTEEGRTGVRDITLRCQRQ